MTSPAIRRRAKEAGIDLALVPVPDPAAASRARTSTLPEGAATGATIAAPASRSQHRRTRKSRSSACGASSPSACDRETRDSALRLRRGNRHHRTRSAAQAPEQQEATGRAADAAAVPRAGADACAARIPAVQRDLRQGAQRLLQHEAVHLGVATQTPDGLKVPVVRHAKC